MARVGYPGGSRTIGIITKLDIMDRGTDAQNLPLGKVIPLQLGYVCVVSHSQEDILMNRSIRDALVAEEEFFGSHLHSRSLWYSSARKEVKQGRVYDIKSSNYNVILAQHIKAVLPWLRAHISNALVAFAKELVNYGEITESKAGQGALLLTILSKYCEAFSSVVEGKNEDMPTTELSGGARIHYIFQSTFVKFLEELNELPPEAKTVERGYSLCEPNGRPNTCRMPTSSADSANSPRRSSHSGKLQPPLHVTVFSSSFFHSFLLNAFIIYVV